MKDYIIECDTLNYHIPTELAYFFGPTFIVSGKDTIYSERGEYETQNNKGSLAKNVRLTNNTHCLETDSLYYQRFSGVSEAFKNTLFYNKL